MLKALWEYHCGRRDFHQGVTRMMGIELTYGNVNEFAGCVTFTLPALYLVFRCRGEFAPCFQRWLKLGLAAYLVMALMCIVLSNSRAGMVKAIFFFFLLCVRGGSFFKKVARLMAAVVFLLGIWVAMPEQNWNRMRTIWDKDAGPEIAAEMAKTRLEGEGFKVGLHCVQRFPLTGVGIGNFPTYRGRYYDGVFAEAHNLGGQVAR